MFGAIKRSEAHAAYLKSLQESNIAWSEICAKDVFREALGMIQEMIDNPPTILRLTDCPTYIGVTYDVKTLGLQKTDLKRYKTRAERDKMSEELAKFVEKCHWGDEYITQACTSALHYMLEIVRILRVAADLYAGSMHEEANDSITRSMGLDFLAISNYIRCHPYRNFETETDDTRPYLDWVPVANILDNLSHGFDIKIEKLGMFPVTDDMCDALEYARQELLPAQAAL
jgi:hypothetical protein